METRQSTQREQTEYNDLPLDARKRICRILGACYIERNVHRPYIPTFALRLVNADFHQLVTPELFKSIRVKFSTVSTDELRKLAGLFALSDIGHVVKTLEINYSEEYRDESVTKVEGMPIDSEYPRGFAGNKVETFTARTVCQTPIAEEAADMFVELLQCLNTVKIFKLWEFALHRFVHFESLVSISLFRLYNTTPDQVYSFLASSRNTLRYSRVDASVFGQYSQREMWLNALASHEPHEEYSVGIMDWLGFAKNSPYLPALEHLILQSPGDGFDSIVREVRAALGETLQGGYGYLSIDSLHWQRHLAIKSVYSYLSRCMPQNLEMYSLTLQEEAKVHESTRSRVISEPVTTSLL